MTIIKKFRTNELSDLVKVIDLMQNCEGEFLQDYYNVVNDYVDFEDLFNWLYDYFVEHLPNVSIKWKKLTYCWKVTINIKTTLELIRIHKY